MKSIKLMFLLAALIAAVSAAAGCKPASSPPEPEDASPPPSEPRAMERREVQVIAVGGNMEGFGMALPMTIRVEGNPSGQPAVGIIEEYADGLEHDTKSSAWMGAIVATQANRQYVNDYEFLVRAEGVGGGPSAGMLLTVGFLAAIRGDEILPATTMTGTIVPDGTCGPVGAIPGKMRGAKSDKGITRFAFPIGSRVYWDGLTKQQVDLLAFGRELGMTEVREIATLEEAYYFMTGRRLETPEPASEADLAMPFTLQQQLQSRSRTLRTRLQARIPVINLKLARAEEKTKKEVGPMLEALNRAIEEGERHEKNGWFAAAYLEAVTADVLYRMIDRFIDFFDPLHREDWKAVEAQVSAASLIPDRIRAFEEEASLLSRRSTIGGRLNAIQAMGHYGQAWIRAVIGQLNFAQFAGDMRAIAEKRVKEDEIERTVQEAISALAIGLRNFALAEAMVDMSREVIGFAVEEGPVTTADLSELVSYGQAFAAAASAALYQVESDVLSGYQRKHGWSLDAAREHFMNQEFHYPFVHHALRATAQQAHYEMFKNPHEQALYQIGINHQGYLYAAEMLNRYYSLGADPDESGEFRIVHRRMLTTQLETARQRAREAAALCLDELGFIPAFTRFHYELGIAGREGDDRQRIDALTSFWEARQIAELALLLGRKQ